MEFRHPKENEIEQMKQIWRECFQDEESYIEFYFQKGYSKENTFVCLENSRVVSMLTMLPAILHTEGEKVPGSYVYAVATKPAYQGKGYMGKLEQFAAREMYQKGSAFLVLVPANEELFSFYERKGYTVCSYIFQHRYQEKLPKSYTQLKAADWEEGIRFQTMEKEEFLRERRAFLKSCYRTIDLGEEEREYSFDEMKKGGYKIVSVKYKGVQGYLVFYIKDRTLYIHEIGMEAHMFLEWRDELLRLTDTDSMVVRMLEAITVTEEEKAYGMVKMLKEGIQFQRAYMNLMLD